ncbi:MAG: Asp-tRNA(Asn)/Glu-tRNA(Gln) amidotransferase subunit GatB [Deltaproteobacteria bacterium]|nr:Asp-tRNA(Asn)/Glu-tRNA(Gln) amidotransferase subunit GatB [Deltaproteobacteria bacterium]
MRYETIIGFETHVELKTESKLFCDCAVRYEAPPNSEVCPVCTGQPGALPVLNRRAVEFSIKAGLALNCRVNPNAQFARKNYFYPDLPKGYQISQYERPFCEDGHLEIVGDDGQPYPVGIKRIHLEEDAGKLVHSAESYEAADYSLVDYNRACVPLLEIVTDHTRNPLRSLNEARRYLEKLRQILQYIEISDCVIEKGQFRCDVNISIRPEGAGDYGNRSEIKNMASFRYMMDALTYEVKRQRRLLASGKSPVQETRLFDEKKKITLPMRSKEDAPDYRYFPDPDLTEIHIDEAFVARVRDTMPELPDQKLDRIIDKYGIPRADALILTRDRAVSGFFEECALHCSEHRKIANWIIKDLFRLLNENALSIEACPFPPRDFADLINFVVQGEITDAIGRSVLEEMFQKGKAPRAIIAQKGIELIKDAGELEKICSEVIEEQTEAASQVRDGGTEPINFLIGQVMKKTKGRANPKKIREILQERLTT